MKTKTEYEQLPLITLPEALHTTALRSSPSIPDYQFLAYRLVNAGVDLRAAVRRFETTETSHDICVAGDEIKYQSGQARLEERTLDRLGAKGLRLLLSELLKLHALMATEWISHGRSAAENPTIVLTTHTPQVLAAFGKAFRSAPRSAATVSGRYENSVDVQLLGAVASGFLNLGAYRLRESVDTVVSLAVEAAKRPPG